MVTPRGAFTGATTEKVGLLEEAQGGSLLLDEIAEMPVDLQAKLLRVLEERVVRRLGGARATAVDFRLISSSNRSPEAAVDEGFLRQDLYFRINTVTIQMPPLRERREDIPLLVRAFFDRYRAKHARRLKEMDPEAYRRLLHHNWPGGVPGNATSWSAPCSSPASPPDHGPRSARILAGAGSSRPGRGHGATGVGSRRSLEAIERASIATKALDQTGSDKQAAAALLGIAAANLVFQAPQAPETPAPGTAS